jgi:hypothetical protein
MTRIITLLFVLSMFSMCTDEKITTESECSTSATVKDLTSLDGCSFVLELEDGKTLIPLRVLFCGTPPLPENIEKDPLADFQLVDGMKVMINYEMLPEMVSVCMAGDLVKITCISEARQQWEL